MLLNRICNDARNDNTNTAADMADVEVEKPSKKVHEVTGVWGVAESTARYAASLG
ncbi:cobalamin biosynthesis protein, partial [Enterobacter quasiroggenkampii]|nr:cobalamin biosynthesis protein [Enterobacter quasiroggenkampii]